MGGGLGQGRAPGTAGDSGRGQSPATGPAPSHVTVLVPEHPKSRTVADTRAPTPSQDRGQDQGLEQNAYIMSKMTPRKYKSHCLSCDHKTSQILLTFYMFPKRALRFEKIRNLVLSLPLVLPLQMIPEIVFKVSHFLSTFF